MRRIVIGLVAAALLATSLAASAQATVREKERIDETWEFTEDCGFPVDVTGSATGVFILREGKNKDDRVFPYLLQFNYYETWTNQETGEWFVIRGHLAFNEVTATHVGGNVFEFRSVEAGQPFVVEDSDGNVLARNRGAVHVTVLFDNGGDDEPGGDFLDVLDVRVAGPHPSLEKSSCDYAAELIG